MRQEDIEGIVSATADACMLVDDQGAILFANAKLYEVLKYDSVEGLTLSDLIPERYRDDHKRGFRLAMRAGYSRYRAGFAVRVAAIMGDGRERAVTIPMLNVMRMERDDGSQTKVSIGSIRPVPTLWSHWRGLAAWSAVLVMVITSGAVVYNNSQIENTRNRLNQQLVVIRDNVDGIRSLWPKFVEGQVSAEDVSNRLQTLSTQIDDLIVGNQRIGEQVDAGIEQDEQ